MSGRGSGGVSEWGRGWGESGRVSERDRGRVSGRVNER